MSSYSDIQYYPDAADPRKGVRSAPEREDGAEYRGYWEFESGDERLDTFFPHWLV